MTIDDETLMAYVDGELHDLERARVDRASVGDASVRQRLNQQFKLREALAARYDPIMQEQLPDKLVALLSLPSADNAPSDTLLRLDVGRGRGLRWVRQNYMAIAAALVAGVFAGQLLPREARGPVIMDGQAMLASGEIAGALETQLASIQAPNSPVRIGVSFRGEGGEFCRTFEAPELAGLACREDADWQLMVTAPGRAATPTGSYLQAVSGSTLVMQAAQSLMTANPLDAAAERAARDAGWTNIRTEQ